MTAPPTPGEPTLAEAVEAVETIVRAYQPRSGPASAARDAAYAALPALRSAAEREAKSAGLPEAFSDATGTIKALTAELASAAEREKALVEERDAQHAAIMALWADAIECLCDGAVVADKGYSLEYVCAWIRKPYAEIASLRSDLDQCRQDLLREGMERDAARSDLERVRGERDEMQVEWRVVNERDDSDRRLSPWAARDEGQAKEIAEEITTEGDGWHAVIETRRVSQWGLAPAVQQEEQSDHD